MNSPDQLVNIKVRVTNLLDETTVGTIYAFNPSHDVLAIKLANASKKTDDYKFINTAFIKSLQVLPPFPRKGHRLAGYLGTLTKADIGQLEAQLARAAVEPKGPKHSAVALKFFDGLVARLGRANVEWAGAEIILVFGEIAISRPYALNRIAPRKPSTHVDEVREALKDIWLAGDSPRRGG